MTFLRSISPRITVSKKELQVCMQKYSLKNSSRPSAFMEDVRRIHDEVFLSSNDLDNSQLRALAKALNAAKSNKDIDTMSACEALYTKMAPVLPYTHNKAETFYKFVCRPQLDKYLKGIHASIDKLSGFCPYFPIDLIDTHPDALRAISESRNFTQTALNNAVCDAVKSVGYQYLMPLADAIDWMRAEEDKIYPEKNKDKNYELFSTANMDLLLIYPKKASLIAEVLIKLHQGGLAKPHRHQAERFIEEMLRDEPEKFSSFANAFIHMPAAITEKLKHTLSKNDFDEIVEDSIREHGFNQLQKALPRIARAAL